MKIYKTSFLREKVVLKKGHKRCSASPAIGKCKSKPPWDRCHFTTTGMSIIRKTDDNCWKDAETLGLSHATDRNVSGAAALENTLAVPQKARVMIWHLGLYPGNTNYRFTQNSHKDIHSSIIHSAPEWKQPQSPLSEEWILLKNVC